MAAYLIADVRTIHDPERMAAYKRDNPPSIEKYGGRYIVRGGATEVVEGRWEPNRVVVIQFPDMETLKRWYYSPEYQPLLAERKAAADSNVIFVEGV